ncbi:MAG: hypothetical protein ACLFMZ_12470, partial [Spirochaetaceae bacterium]
PAVLTLPAIFLLLPIFLPPAVFLLSAFLLSLSFYTPDLVRSKGRFSLVLVTSNSHFGRLKSSKMRITSKPLAIFPFSKGL